LFPPAQKVLLPRLGVGRDRGGKVGMGVNMKGVPCAQLVARAALWRSSSSNRAILVAENALSSAGVSVGAAVGLSVSVCVGTTGLSAGVAANSPWELVQLLSPMHINTKVVSTSR